jgi:endonuclease/exonuclease/phosphatase family metal-dependent hydrolase
VKNEVTIATWNILHGASLGAISTSVSEEIESVHSSSEHLHYIAELMNDVDVLGIVEVDAHQKRSDHLHQVEVIAKNMGADFWIFQPTLIGTPGSSWRKYQEEISTALANLGENLNPPPLYGIGLISKIPVKRWHSISLGRSPVGLPLAFPTSKGTRMVYVKDEPRYAIAAELETGMTVALTHLSFVPFVNFFQLLRVKRWLRGLGGDGVLMGDLNLPWNLPTAQPSRWRSLVRKNSYPSWGGKVQFDYILMHHSSLKRYQVKEVLLESSSPVLGQMSDHLPLGITLIRR